MYILGNFRDLITAKMGFRSPFRPYKTFAKKGESASNAFRFNLITLSF